jgi:thioesterase CepJ
VTTGSVNANGVRLSYEVSGEGEPVLLISGTGMSGSDWNFLGAEALRSAGYRVITFDNRGTGASEGPPGPYSVAGMALDAVGLLDELGLRNVRVVGNSLGGYVGLELTSARPDLVQSLVLWVAAGDSPAFFRRLMALERDLRSMMPLPDSWYLWEYLLISLPFAVLQNDDDLVEQVAELLSAGIAWSGDGQAGQFAADVEWSCSDHSDLYAEVRCPCLVIAHELDIIHPPSAGRAAAAIMPDARFIEIPGLAHGQALDAAPVAVPAILAFFDGSTGR